MIEYSISHVLSANWAHQCRGAEWLLRQRDTGYSRWNSGDIIIFGRSNQWEICSHVLSKRFVLLIYSCFALSNAILSLLFSVSLPYMLRKVIEGH